MKTIKEIILAVDMVMDDKHVNRSASHQESNADAKKLLEALKEFKTIRNECDPSNLILDEDWMLFSKPSRSMMFAAYADKLEERMNQETTLNILKQLIGN